MTISKILRGCEPRIDYELVLGYVLNKPRWYLIAHSDDVLLDEDYCTYLKLVDKLKQGIPVQYIIGKQEFMGYTFLVNENVLIPRSDTEVLVYVVVDYIRKNNLKNPKILDLCTGSGCIAVSIARLIKDAQVVASDISDLALEVARKNAIGLNIEFLKSDMFKNIPNNEFDIIVSNPPYIATDVISKLDNNVKDYEPILALDGGKDGLDFYRNIFKNIHLYLKEKGFVALEIGYDQFDSISKLNNLYKLNLLKDFNGNDRVINFEYNIGG